MPSLRILRAALAPAAIALLAGCSPDSSSIDYPAADLRPPGLLAAGPTGSREVLLRFDEAVTPVAGSLAAEPGASVSAKAEGGDLVVGFAQAQAAGADYSLVGEVEDSHGNRTRFLVRFTGWNDRAPPLLVSELQPCKNSSKTKPHRDFVEFEVLEDGNLGGEEVSWASSVKTESYRFPSAEVRKGDFVVLHLAPEGIAAERDETGSDLSASGGVDATPAGRDFWCGAMPLPDSSGAIAVARRPGSQPMDGLFYADDGKSGAVGEGKLAELVSSLSASGAWPLAGAAPAWGDGVAWSGSSAKSICRSGSGKGREAWFISSSGGQSPGAANQPAALAKAEPARPAAARTAAVPSAAGRPETSGAGPEAASVPKGANASSAAASNTAGNEAAAAKHPKPAKMAKPKKRRAK